MGDAGAPHRAGLAHQERELREAFGAGFTYVEEGTGPRVPGPAG
ncbi:hypothetical protein [Calidithermus terrae]|nr:hypothetical protein [Calidithermus terrae]